MNAPALGRTVADWILVARRRPLLLPGVRLSLRHAAILGLASVLAWGCVTPHEYLYRPPVPVKAEDRQICHARANAVAQRRYDRYMEILELAGPFGGPFGGTTLGQRAWEEREDFYEWEMKACLRERGYAL